MHPTSFISEHTAEYALVHDLVAILSMKYANVVPMYFWTTREGATMALRSVGDCRVRIITAYARRPKVCSPTDTIIFMKVNSLLLQAGAMGVQTGIPVFTGVPLATGLLQYSINTPCCWFHIQDEYPDGRDINITISLSGKRQEDDSDSSGIIGPLKAKDILSLVKKHARLMCWEEAVDCMRRIRCGGEIRMGAFYFSDYRPFYLVLPEKDE